MALSWTCKRSARWRGAPPVCPFVERGFVAWQPRCTMAMTPDTMLVSYLWGIPLVNSSMQCHRRLMANFHYNDVIMGAIASEITSLAVVYSTVYSGADQRKHQSSASLPFVRGMHRSLLNSPHKVPVTPCLRRVMRRFGKKTSSFCASTVWYNWPAHRAGLLRCNSFGQPGSVYKFPPFLWVKLWVGWVGRGYIEISRYFPALWINRVTLVTKIKLWYSLGY